MMLAFALPPAIAGEKTVTISRNDISQMGVYYCDKGGVTMTFTSGMNNPNYLVEHQQVVFYIRSNNYVIKKIVFHCLDNTTENDLDAFYWGPSTISEEGEVGSYTPTGTYTYTPGGYIGTWVAGSVDSKNVAFTTKGRPVRFGSVEITYEKEFGDIFELVKSSDEIAAGNTYALVSKYSSRALGKVENHQGDDYESFSSTPVTLLDHYQQGNIDVYNKVKVTDEVSLIKLERAVSTTTSRPWHLKVGDNYIRRRNGEFTSGSGTNAGYNLWAVPNLPTDEFNLYFFRVSISIGTNYNALLKFYHTNSEVYNSTDMAIRHYNGGSLFRVMNSNSSSNSDATLQRVYLYKPAQSYEVTTECIPSNGGYITLGGGVLTDDHGKNWSQHFDNVTFFVGPTGGYGISNVTITDLNTRETTILDPVNTSDFGNDYSFEMPANDVKITANFLQPYDIHTVINPNSDSGSFEFIDGYTDFNGQPKSNERKTVIFKPVAADGYSFTSVTGIDDVTGQPLNITLDADGNYSFEMPGNSVTLTANFEEANDLYLLGTANGQTAWHPYGPKFTFDGERQVYYIDVYFKGDSLYNNGAGDPYGHFSLSRAISTNPDENTGWGEISGSRIYATSPDYRVEDGHTYNNCFQRDNDMAFKIPAGVYRITVGKDLDYMSIEDKTTLVFTPAGGDSRDNATVVNANTEVTVTSNLEQLVHDINRNEPSHATFYNTVDNWGSNEHDNTRVISNVGVTEMIANANLGYIKKEDKAYYEIIGDLYLLGTANGESAWHPYGPQFTYDETNQEFYIDVYFKGGLAQGDNADPAYGYFSLTTKIGNDWSDINGSRLFANTGDTHYWVEDGNTYNNCFQTSYDRAFKIKPGVYHITVNRAKTQMTITEYPLSLTFDPVSGSTVAAGDPVNISSNLDQLVHGINPNEDNATFKYATSTDGTLPLPTPNTQGSTVNITAVGATTTVNAQAELGYIVVPGNANYTVPAPTVYNITTQVNPDGSNAGEINAPTGSEANQTVNFTVTDTDPRAFVLTGVEVVDSNNGIVASFEPSADGTYSFTMPNDDVTIHADYDRVPYDVTTSWSPADGGAIWLNGVNTPQTVSVANGNQVVFGVAPAEGYRMTSLRVVNQWTHEEITPTPTGTSNEYTFTMPTGDVTITAQFDNWYNVTLDIDPEDAGSITVYALSNGKKQAGSNVQFAVYSRIGYVLESVTVTNDETGETIEMTQEENNYFFVMPADNVTITAHYVPGYYIRTQCVPAEGGTIDVATHAEENEAVSFTVTPSAGYVLTGLTVKEEIGGSSIEYSYDDVSGTYSFTMPATSVKITAHFSAADYLITTAVDPEGSGSLSFTGATYDEFNNQYRADEGDVVKFSATPNNGWRLNRITVTGPDGEIATSTSSPYYLTMPACDVTVTAYFVRVYNITKECLPPEGGTIELPNTRAAEGQVLSFTVDPSNGYGIQDVTVNYVDEDNEPHTIILDAGANNSYEFTMPAADVTVTARFGILYYIFKECYPVQGGTIDVVSPALEGQSVSFSVNENSGYVLNHVTMEYNENNETQTTTFTPGDYNFIMPAATVWIRAYFDKLHTIETICTPPEGGSITVDNTAAVNGAPISFTVDANPGYSVNNVTMSYEDSWHGIQSTTLTPDDNGVYHFTMPDYDVTITAEFGIKGEYQVNLVNYPPQGGSMTAEGHVRIENNNVYSDEGKTVVITPTPSADWLFDGISAQDEHGNPVTLTNNGDGTYSMVMPAEDVTVTANYYQILPPDPYNIYTDFDPQQGSVTLTGDAADALAFGGETVTFTVEAFYQSGYMADKYKIDEVYVTIDGTEDQVPVTKLSGGDMQSNYSFTMPEGNVTVHATFKRVYEVILHWTPVHYGADRIDVFEPGHFPGGDASNVIGRFTEGTTVEIRVKNLWENSDHGNYTIEYCGAYYYDPGNGIFGEVIEEIDQNGFVDLGNHDYRVQFVMPACDVDAYINLRAHTTLKFIESSQYIPDGALVEVSDELIGTWSAQNVLWAKDQVESFNKTEKEDGAHDYVRNELRLQKKAWNQNNGVRLRFDNVLYSLMENEGLDPGNPDDENAVKVFTEEFYKEIEGFVDNYIKGGTIKGEFRCDGNYIDEGLEIIIDNPGDCYGHNHKAAFEIWVEEMPKHRDGYNPTQPSESLGYPGYIPDPREEPLSSEGGFYEDPIKYNYNHYTTANFCATNIAGRSGLYEDGDNIVGLEAPDSLQNKKVFFMNPKDGEIAQVWGVYAGQVNNVTVVPMPKCHPLGKEKWSGDLFTIYKSAPGYNRHDFAGYFLVDDVAWQYNRLSSDRFDFGKPKNQNELHPGEAYLFHVAIEEIGSYNDAPRAPRREPGPDDVKDVPEGGLLLPFRVYPLDLYSPDKNWTSVHEIKSREASEIESIRYYNVMGQESKTPFDGINIEVIRYKDGSMISNKIYR